MARRARTPKAVENITHEYAKRRNLPSAEHEPLMRDEERNLIRVAYERPSSDLEPQITWQGKDELGRSDLVVNAPPLYIQERMHPKALVKDLMQKTARRRDAKAAGMQSDFADLFADFNGLPSEDAKTEFYQHNANWSNRMVLGDNIQVMASLAEREGLRGKVQCIYIDPPYGIRFNSNFQWSTTSREPEQVKPFRDNWRDGRLQNELGWHDDRGNLLRFLDDPGIEPTNNRAERTLRGAVIARKVSHCSKNEDGADAFSAFTSVLRTLALNGGDQSLVDGLCGVFSGASIHTPSF